MLGADRSNVFDTYSGDVECANGTTKGRNYKQVMEVVFKL